MRVVFMGTPALAATVLQALAGAHDVVGVYTRPDAVRGRGKRLVASPVKELALELGLDVRTPVTLRDPAAAAELEALSPDAVCVAAYGMLLPPEVLGIPRHGCLNVHSSLLPRWRGAAPIERAILAGDEQTGVCIMRMEEGLDTGPYCLREAMNVGDGDLAGLADALAQSGARLLLEALALAESGEIEWRAQADEGVTYAAKIGKAELHLAPEDTTADGWRKIRASSGAHPAKAVIDGKQVTVETAALAGEDAPEVQAGQVAWHAKRLYLGMADSPLELLRVKPDGKKSLDASSFASGIQGIKNRQLEWGAVK